MARSKITICDNSAINTLNAITKDAADKTENHYIDIGGDDESRFDYLTLVIDNLATVSCEIVVKAGDSYEQHVLGDLTLNVAKSSANAYKVESSRFKDDDGYILIDITSSGTISGSYLWAIQN
jgi:hypothetical protein